MARLIYTERALSDLERLADFLLEKDAALALRVVELIEEAVTILKHHPWVGRPGNEGLRELVISHGTTGYLALYEYDPIEEVVLILALRYQLEAGYPEAD